MLYTADDTACQADFDSVGVCGRFCEYVFNHTLRQFPGALVLFPDHLNIYSRFNIRSLCSAHLYL